MEQDKFDKELAKRMQTQQMQPDDAIWSRIETTLNTIAPIEPIRKRNLLKISTAVSSIAAALLLSFLLLRNNEKPTENLVTISSPEIENEVPVKPISIEEKIAFVQPKITKSPRIKTTAPSLSHEPAPVNALPEEAESEVKQKENTKRTRGVTFQNSIQQPLPKKSTGRSSQKGDWAIGVSGSGNFSSSSSATGNNAIVRPMKAINENNVMSLYSSKNSNRKWKHNMPLAFSVTVQKMFTRKIGIETGLTYTYLSSTSKGESILDQDIKQQLNYLGIPLSVVYSIVEGRKFGLYAKGGFLLDKAIAAKGTSKLDGISQSIDVSTKGVQFSALLQVGASYNLTNYMSLYLEPTGNYYFNSSQPISYRTENDFGFTAMIGLRFKIK